MAYSTQWNISTIVTFGLFISGSATSALNVFIFRTLLCLVFHMYAAYFTNMIKISEYCNVFRWVLFLAINDGREIREGKPSAVV